MSERDAAKTAALRSEIETLAQQGPALAQVKVEERKAVAEQLADKIDRKFCIDASARCPSAVAWKPEDYARQAMLYYNFLTNKDKK